MYYAGLGAFTAGREVIMFSAVALLSLGQLAAALPGGWVQAASPHMSGNYPLRIRQDP